MKKITLEPWGPFDKLCLISTMHKLKQTIGDQNWAAISRHTKQLYETVGGLIEYEKRSDDWFSIKQCAAQYEALIKSLGTRKRKRGERHADNTESLELLEANLKQELIEELQATLAKLRKDYMRSKQIIEDIDNNRIDDERLEELLAELGDKSIDIRSKLKTMLDEKNAETENSTKPSQPASTVVSIEPPVQTTESKPCSTASPLLTSLLQSPSPLVRTSLPSASSPTISLLLHSSPPVPITDSTLSKLLETPPTLPTTSATVTSTLSLPSSSGCQESSLTYKSVNDDKTIVIEQKENEKIEEGRIILEELTEVEHGVVESEIIIEQQESPPTKKSVPRRLDLEVEDVDTEEDVMETVEEIIERVEEAIIETVGENNLGDLDLSQSDQPTITIDCDVDGIDITHEQTVEVIVLGSSQDIVNDGSNLLNNDTVIISGAPVKINDDTVVINEGDDTSVKLSETVVLADGPVNINESTVILADAPVRINEDTVVIHDSQVKIDEATVVINSSPMKIINEAVVIEDSSGKIDEGTVIDSSPMKIINEAVVIEDSSGKIDEETVIDSSQVKIINEAVVIEDSSEKMDEETVIDSSTMKIINEAVVIEDSSEKIDEGTVIDSSPMKIISEAVVIEDSSEKIDEGTVIDSSPMKIINEAVVIEDSSGKIDEETVIDSSAMKIINEAVVIEDSSEKIDEETVIDSSPMKIINEAVVIEDSSGNIVEGTLLDSSPMKIINEAVVIEDSSGKIDEGTVIDSSQVKIINEAVVIGDSSGKIDEGTVDSAMKEIVETIVINDSPVKGIDETIVIDDSPRKEFDETHVINDSPVKESGEIFVIEDSPVKEIGATVLIEDSPVKVFGETLVIEDSPGKEISETLLIEDSPVKETNKTPVISDSPMKDINETIVIDDSPRKEINETVIRDSPVNEFTENDDTITILDDSPVKNTVGIVALDHSPIKNTEVIEDSPEKNVETPTVIQSPSTNLERMILDESEKRGNKTIIISHVPLETENDGPILIENSPEKVNSNVLLIEEAPLTSDSGYLNKTTSNANNLSTKITDETLIISDTSVSSESISVKETEKTSYDTSADCSKNNEEDDDDDDKDEDFHSVGSGTPLGDNEECFEIAEGSKANETDKKISNSDDQEQIVEVQKNVSKFPTQSYTMKEGELPESQEKSLESPDKHKKVPILNLDEVDEEEKEFFDKVPDSDEDTNASKDKSDSTITTTATTEQDELDDKETLSDLTEIEYEDTSTDGTPPNYTISAALKDKEDTFVSVMRGCYEKVKSKAAELVSSPPKNKDKDKKKKEPSEKKTEKPPRLGRKRPQSSIDSIPDSPSLSISSLDEDRDLRAWKKSIMLVFNRLASHKFASVFSKPITEHEAPGYHDIVHRPMDLSSIKKAIENGSIKTTVEFQRDMLLMVQNAIIYNKTTTPYYKMAIEMGKDMLTEMEVMVQALGDGVPLLGDMGLPRARSSKTSSEDSSKKRKSTASDEGRSGKRKRTSSS